MAKKKATKKEENSLNLETILFNCRDYLRGSASLNDKRDVILTLVFLRFIGEKFDDAQAEMRQQCINRGITDEEKIARFLDSPSRYKNIVYVPEAARWSMLINVPASNLVAALDDALQAIEDSGDTLKGCVKLSLFTSVKIQSNELKKVVDEVNKISHKVFGEEKDLIGRVYEYFLKSFAVNATKEEGEFYTPHDIVELIAAFIEPFDGTLYDPCCGSGGMFIQCAKYVEAKQGDITTVNVFGQEKEDSTFRLAKMNLAMRGISHHLGDGPISTFDKDQHAGLVFDYIMANPPFNLKHWFTKDVTQQGVNWADYGTPPESNANYAWILHMLSKLKADKGIAGPSDEYYAEVVKAMVADYGVKTYEDSSKEAYDNVFKIDEKDIKSIIDNDEDLSPYNASSLIILYEPGDGKRLLFAGDANTTSLQMMLNKYKRLRNVDLLKVPHHGSRRNLNTSIIEALSPKKCYISAAGNKKHPSGRLVYWLAKYGDVYSTHTCNSYIHCQSGAMPNRIGCVTLIPLKKKIIS